MDEVRRLPGVDHADPVLSAVVDGGLAHRARPCGTIHPHASDPGLGTVADHLLRGGRCGHEQSGVHRRRNVLHPGEASLPLDLGGTGIHGDDVIVPALQLPEEAVRELLWVPGDADDGHALRRAIQGYLQKLRKVADCHTCSSEPAPRCSDRSLRRKPHRLLTLAPPKAAQRTAPARARALRTYYSEARPPSAARRR